MRVSNRDTDPPMQKLLHAVDVLCIDYYEACPRKNRANKWNGCHSRPDRAVLTASAEKNCWDFVHAFGISSLASGRGGPRYCGGQPSGCKNGLSAPTSLFGGSAHARVRALPFFTLRGSLANRWRRGSWLSRPQARAPNLPIPHAPQFHNQHRIL